MHASTHTHIYTHTLTHTYTRTHARTHTHTHTHTHSHERAHVRVCVCVGGGDKNWRQTLSCNEEANPQRYQKQTSVPKMKNLLSGLHSVMHKVWKVRTGEVIELWEVEREDLESEWVPTDVYSWTGLKWGWLMSEVGVLESLLLLSVEQPQSSSGLFLSLWCVLGMFVFPWSIELWRGLQDLYRAHRR